MAVLPALDRTPQPLERVVHAPPFALTLCDALRKALGREADIEPATVAVWAVARVVEGGVDPLAEPRALLRRVGRGDGTLRLTGDTVDAERDATRRLPAATWRLRLDHPAFVPARIDLELPIAPPAREPVGAPPPADHRERYARLLAERRREIVLRPGPGYPLPDADTPARPRATPRTRSQLVVEGRFEARFDGRVRLSRPEADAPGGSVELDGSDDRAVDGRRFVLWAPLPRDETLPDGELELTLEPAGGRPRKLVYDVDLAVADPAARATLAPPRRPRAQPAPPTPTLTLLKL